METSVGEQAFEEEACKRINDNLCNRSHVIAACPSHIRFYLQHTSDCVILFPSSLRNRRTSTLRATRKTYVNNTSNNLYSHTLATDTKRSLIAYTLLQSSPTYFSCAVQLNATTKTRHRHIAKHQTEADIKHFIFCVRRRENKLKSFHCKLKSVMFGQYRCWIHLCLAVVCRGDVRARGEFEGRGCHRNID
jgi:hypothetical protein